MNDKNSATFFKHLEQAQNAKNTSFNIMASGLLSSVKIINKTAEEVF